MINAKSAGHAGYYQKLKPVTDLVKKGSKEYPAQGKKEIERRLKNQLRVQEK